MPLAIAVSLLTACATANSDPACVCPPIRKYDREFQRKLADEIEAALDTGDNAHLAEETGDLLFAVVNLARHAGADPEMALRGTNAKFEKRFAYIERTLAAKGRSLADATLQEMDALWDEAKTADRPADAPVKHGERG